MITFCQMCQICQIYAKFAKNAFRAGNDIYDIVLQKVQTVQSWLAQNTSLFVDAKVTDQIHAWAQATMKSAVRRNLEEPEKYFQNYGNVP